MARAHPDYYTLAELEAAVRRHGSYARKLHAGSDQFDDLPFEVWKIHDLRKSFTLIPTTCKRYRTADVEDALKRLGAP